VGKVEAAQTQQEEVRRLGSNSRTTEATRGTLRGATVKTSVGVDQVRAGSDREEKERERERERDALKMDSGC
jgi:hypothetical protein